MAQRTIGETLALPLRILAVVAVVGFMFWLYTYAEPTEVAVEEEEEAEPAADAFVELVHDNPEFYFDQRIRFSEVDVGTRIGLNAFWAEQYSVEVATGEAEAEDDEERFGLLVRIPREMVDQGIAVGEGDQVWVSGFLHEVTDSVVAAWEEDGVFDDTADVELVEAEELFLEADELSTDPPDENDEDDVELADDENAQGDGPEVL